MGRTPAEHLQAGLLWSLCTLPFVAVTWGTYQALAWLQRHGRLDLGRPGWRGWLVYVSSFYLTGLAAAVMRASARATARARSGVCRQRIPALTANWPASCGPPFGPHRSTLAAAKREPGKAKARPSWPQKRQPCKNFAFALASARRSALLSGPLQRRWTAVDKARRGARTMRARSPSAHGCAVGEPRPPFTNLPRRMRGRRRCWVVLLFGFFLLDKQEKETGPQGCGTNHARTRVGFRASAKIKAKIR